jgi:hypothetical protein
MKRIILREDKLNEILGGEDLIYDKLTDEGKKAVDNLKLAIGSYYTLLGRGIPQEPYGKLWVDYLNPLREKLMGL